MRYAYKDKYGTWYAQFRIPNTKKRFKSPLSKDKTEAQLKLNRLLHQYGVGINAYNRERPAIGCCVKDAYTLYYDSHICLYSSRHKDYLTLIITRFLDFINVNDIIEIRYSHCQLYMNYLHKRYKPATLHKYRVTINHFLTFCKRMEWIDKNPFKGVKYKKVTYDSIYHFSHEEKEKIRCSSLPYTPWWLFLLETGMRACDARLLNQSHFVKRDGRMFLHFTSTKTNMRMDVPISKTAEEIVRSSGEIIFKDTFTVNGKQHYDPFKTASLKTLRTTLRYDKKDSTINHHTFRHTFAISHLCNGMPKEVLQTFLGHTSIKTTELYYANWIHKSTLINYI